jgi:hypothetical protein
LAITAEATGTPVSASATPQAIAEAAITPATPATDGLSQSRVISVAQPAPAQPPLFQPRDRDTLPGWIWIVVACAQLAAIVYVLRRIFRRGEATRASDK